MYIGPNLVLSSGVWIPTFRYKGEDANAVDFPAWDYGPTLTLQSGTAPTFNQGSPFPGDGVNDSVKFNQGGYYTIDTGAPILNTKDLIIHAICRKNINGDGVGIVANWYTSNYLGFACGMTDTTWGITMGRTGGGMLACTATGLSLGNWYDCWFALNPSENSVYNSRVIINGAYAQQTNLYAYCEDFISQKLQLGWDGYPAPSEYFKGNIALIEIWIGADMIGAGDAGMDEIEAIAADRYSKLSLVPVVYRQWPYLPTDNIRDNKINNLLSINGHSLKQIS